MSDPLEPTKHVAPPPPTITQTVPTTGEPVAADTVVADLAADGAETFEISDNPSGLFAVEGATLKTTDVADGAFSVSVTATNVDGTSAPTTATLTFADDENPMNDTEDPYSDNPNIPAPLPPGTTVLPWSNFIVTATNMLRPHARNGVDFVVARPSKDAENESVYWDDAVLGPRPDAEIQALAEELAAGNPYYLPPSA